MNEIRNVLDDMYEKGCIVDYDIFELPYAIQIEILGKNTSQLYYNKIIRYLDNKITKVIDYDFDKNHKWQSFELYD